MKFMWEGKLPSQKLFLNMTYIHLQEYAEILIQSTLMPNMQKNTFFGERIAHGMLTASLYSTVIGMALPGCGTIFMEQSCKFLKPVKFGDTVTALAEVVDVKPEKRIVKLKVSVVNQNEETVIDGDATVMAGKSKA